MFVNPTAAAVVVPLGGRRYLDLDQNPVNGSLALDPFSSRVLVDDGPADELFADGFESGGTAAWSAVLPQQGDGDHCGLDHVPPEVTQ